MLKDSKYIELIKEYPDIYKDFDRFECYDGWFDILKDLSEKLRSLSFTADVIQVKEKFAGLRFYVSSATEEQWAVISEAEHKSYSVCEICGKPGYLTRHGWLRTLCKECEANRLRKNSE